jgi:hypothetical protein
MHPRRIRGVRRCPQSATWSAAPMAHGSSVHLSVEVVYWLATSPEADAYNGECIQGQEFCHERKLLAGWNPKVALDGPIIHPSKVR